MRLLAHREDGRWSYPRHPLVCVLDVVGFCITIRLMALYKPSFLTATLPIAIAIQYVVSFLHHWMPFSDLRSKLDRSVIFLVIGATYVPYWSQLLPPEEALHRLPWVGLATFAGIAFLLEGAPELAIGIYWAVFACAGLAISFWEIQVWLPWNIVVIFWFGSSLYGLQQLVYACKYPNPYPEVLGYREVQHMILLVATTIGSIVALQYT